MADTITKNQDAQFITHNLGSLVPNKLEAPGLQKLPVPKKSTKPTGFGGKVNSALGNNIGQGIMGGVSSALDIAKGFVPTQESKGKNPTGFETQQAIGDALTKVPIPIVQAAGLAYKGISMLAEATGGNTNSITKEQAEDLIQYIEAQEQQNGIWDTNIFGKTVEQLVADGIHSKISSIDDEGQIKLQDTMQKIVNDSNGGMVCIII